MPATTPQGRYWICTIPHHDFTPYLPAGISWIKGQLELGVGGYLHWQCILSSSKKIRLISLKNLFGQRGHFELSRSEAAEAYCGKEETRVEGTQFELGTKALKRNSKVDWDEIRKLAEEGKFKEIDSSAYIHCHSSLHKIHVNHTRPIHRDVQDVRLYWGVSGSGKSHRAFEEAGDLYYLKAPLTKWWDGYQGEEIVIIDEFRGIVDISHLLKWLDKYPCSAEIKGSQTYLKTKTWIFTSNICIDDWYPNLDPLTLSALKRRFTSIVHFNGPWGGIMQ